jgi:hypothetical protein
MGGDLSAAMKIGRLVRKFDGWTKIWFDDKCYSSCALIFIAGVRRTSFGELGLHRPYYGSAPQTRQQLEKQVPLMLAALKQYVSEMGITDNFYQQMVNTEPSQIRKYRSDYETIIPATDPVYQEIEIAYDARRRGITTAEMRQREKDGESCPVGNLKRTSLCRDAVSWGLSERVYQARRSKVEAECSLREEERKVLREVQWNERRDHPIAIRRENCERNTMLGQ